MARISGDLDDKDGQLQQLIGAPFFGAPSVCDRCKIFVTLLDRVTEGAVKCNLHKCNEV